MKFEYFREILTYGPRSKWMSLDPPTYEQSDQGFKDCISAYYAEYSEQLDTRDVLIKSLRTRRFLKPADVSVDAHKERIETLCRYANKLQGTEALLTEGSNRSILFGSFPQKWKTKFIMSGKEVSSCNTKDIIRFMKICKQVADVEDGRNKGNKQGKRKGNDEDTDSKKGRGKSRYKKG